jgi:predicted nuclease with TOPRIM domain
MERQNASLKERLSHVEGSLSAKEITARRSIAQTHEELEASAVEKEELRKHLDEYVDKYAAAAERAEMLEAELRREKDKNQTLTRSRLMLQKTLVDQITSWIVMGVLMWQI